MSTTPVEDSKQTAESRPGPVGELRDYGLNYWGKLRGGDMGSVPALVGLIVLTILFSIVHSGFLSAYNIEALVTQSVPIIIMALGLVFVLLLGEIDLSAGTTGGLCSAIMAVLMERHGVQWFLTILAAIATGLVVGAATGFLRAKVRIPSFVVTLATFLGFQGIVLIVIGGSGAVTLHNSTVIALEGLNNRFMPLWLGWVLLAVVAGGYAAVKLYDGAKRRMANLPSEPVAVVLVKVGVMVVVGIVFVILLSQNRSVNSNAFFHATSEGIPWAVLLVLVLIFGATFVLNRTRYGRHIYAVGGNEEASRRAGIRVDMIRMSVFVVCSTLAAVSGIAAASLAESVASDSGAGNTLLLAVGAAVIGGTSLFGGRGRAVDAVLGGLVVAVIQNGMSDLINGSNSSGYQWIVTGGVLLLAAGFDAVSRYRGRDSLGGM